MNLSSLVAERQNGEVLHQYADTLNAVEVGLQMFVMVLSAQEVVGFLLTCS